MRILFICQCSPLQEGGAEVRSKEVALRLVKMGHAVTILCMKTDIQEPPVEDYHGARIICKKIVPDWILRKTPYPSYFLLAISSLFLMLYIPFLLRKERFDLIREDISPSPPSGLLSLVRLPARRRIAVTHNLSGTLRGWVKFYGPLYGLAGFFMNRLLRSGALKYDRIICDGQWFADELRQFPKIAHKVAYVPNGVNLECFKSNETWPNRSKMIRLLCVGRLVETKGHGYVIEALAHIKSAYPNVKLDIFGRGPLRKQLAQLAQQLSVSHMVEFHVPVRHDEMPEVYRRYDFFVLPSVFEGLPLVLIEAAASKLPIIATDIPGVTTVLDCQSATLALSENALDLADQIKWALEHPEEIRQKTALAYERAQKYDWDITARQEIDEGQDAQP